MSRSRGPFVVKTHIGTKRASAWQTSLILADTKAQADSREPVAHPSALRRSPLAIWVRFLSALLIERHKVCESAPHFFLRRWIQLRVVSPGQPPG